MTTTDTDALTERLARVMHAGEVAEGFAADAWDGMSADSRAWYRANAVAVLPIVGEEVRKAQAEAFDEGWKDRARRDAHRAYAFLDEKRNVPGPPRSLNPYRETGDQR